jgi:hypothetical protein
MHGRYATRSELTWAAVIEDALAALGEALSYQRPACCHWISHRQQPEVFHVYCIVRPVHIREYHFIVVTVLLDSFKYHINILVHMTLNVACAVEAEQDKQVIHYAQVPQITAGWHKQSKTTGVGKRYALVRKLPGNHLAGLKLHYSICCLYDLRSV